jgi:hypothetical protein
VSKIAAQFGGSGTRHAADATIDSLDQLRKEEPEL